MLKIHESACPSAQNVLHRGAGIFLGTQKDVGNCQFVKSGIFKKTQHKCVWSIQKGAGTPSPCEVYRRFCRNEPQHPADRRRKRSYPRNLKNCQKKHLDYFLFARPCGFRCRHHCPSSIQPGNQGSPVGRMADASGSSYAGAPMCFRHPFSTSIFFFP